MKKLARILGVLVIALALFTNLNTNSDKTEADILAFNIADAMMFAPEVKCRDSDLDTDYCVSGGFKFGCVNSTAKDDCDGTSGGGGVSVY